MEDTNEFSDLHFKTLYIFKLQIQRATNEGFPEISQEEFPYPFEEVGYNVCPQGDMKICSEVGLHKNNFKQVLTQIIDDN